MKRDTEGPYEPLQAHELAELAYQAEVLLAAPWGGRQGHALRLVAAVRDLTAQVGSLGLALEQAVRVAEVSSRTDRRPCVAVSSGSRMVTS